MNQKIIIVDKDDKVIGCKDRDKITKNDIYRVSSLWIVNSKGETLLARRAYTKDHDPGKWQPAVAGTVEKGEDYYSNILKETEEEIGIKNIKVIKAHKESFSSKRSFIGQWYVAKVDKNIGDFRIDKNEVAEIRWFSRQDLMKLFKQNPEEIIISGTKDKWLKLFDKFGRMEI